MNLSAYLHYIGELKITAVKIVHMLTAKTWGGRDIYLT